MLVRIDPASSAPLHEQIAASIRRGISEGALGQGERLPAASELADVLQVHPHTVLRAYRALDDEGVLEIRRGRGATRVRSAGGTRARLTQLARELAREAKRNGLTKREAAALIEERW